MKTFPSRSEFRDLVQLTNYTDPESDFFEHMKHIQVKAQLFDWFGSKNNNAIGKWIWNVAVISVVLAPYDHLFSYFIYFDYKSVSLGCVHGLQVHRRGRALRKLAKQLTEGTVVMSSRTMQNFIMPYAMIALFDEKLLKVDIISV